MARLFNNILLFGTHTLRERVKNLFKPVKVQIGNPWYQEIQPKSFYSEEDLERAVLLNLEALFPDFHALTYKRKLKSRISSTTNAPDLALIAKDYSSWYIIEVELADHNVNHVVQQISTFYNASYGQEDVQYFIKKRPKLFIEKKLDNLIASNAPKLMVIANEFNQTIQDEIKIYDCKYCVFQMFLDKDANPIYRLAGDYPLIKNDYCFCFLEKQLPFTVKLLDDNQFITRSKWKHGDIIDISFNNRLSKWELSIDKNHSYLLCNSKNLPLEPSTSRYLLSYDEALNLFTFSKT